MRDGIFLTIQGEGPDVGKAAVFFRTAGCNLRCTWCDTPDSLPEFDVKARNFLPVVSDNVEVMTPSQAVHRINLVGGYTTVPTRVVITGGEPWLQAEGLLLLCNLLIDQGTQVSIETNCEIDILAAVHYVTEMACHAQLKCVFSPKLARLRAGKLTAQTVINNIGALKAGNAAIKLVVSSIEECWQAIAFIKLIQAAKPDMDWTNPKSDRTWYGLQIEDSWLKAGWISNLGMRMQLVYALAAADIRLCVQEHKVLNID